MSAVKQRTGELRVLMQARRLGFGRSPLRRPVDRVEAVLLWSTIVLALLMIPVGAAVGVSLRQASDAAANQQRASLSEVKAHTLEATERRVPTAPGDVLSRTRIGYTDPQGVERETTTTVVIGTPAGAAVTIWLDHSGRLVPAPRSPSDSAAISTSLGLMIIATSWLLLWGAFRLARVPLDRRRSRAWANEWASVSPRWLRGQK